jgi:predicted nuclease with RNAse H fold
VRLVGLHLLQPLGLVASARRSALAEVDESGRLLRLELLGGDDEIIGALPPAPALVAVDAPLAVPDEEGQRDLERVLAWCDVPVFPVSRRRLRQVFGGARGMTLAPALGADGRAVVETLPDLLLRELAWERERPPGTAPLDLADYRAAWLAVRAPAYRPKAAGRARAAGLAPARALLADALDLGGWAPAADADDWSALHDAARLDALACACVALRLHRDADALTATLGAPERGRVVVAADANLRGRLAVNLARMRAEGTIRI